MLSDSGADVGEAVKELHGYFSDRVAPLLVTDAAELLLNQPAALVGSAIETWARRQTEALGATLPVADYYYHAAKKLHQLGEFGLLPTDYLKTYLTQLFNVLVESCPPEDRDRLMEGLDRLGEVELGTDTAVDLLLRPAGAERPRTAGGSGLSAQAERNQARFTVLLGNIGSAPGQRASAAGGASSGVDDGLLTELLTTAALGSRSAADFDQFLGQLSQRGLKVGPGEMFRALGRTLPGWVHAMPSGPGVKARKVPPPAPVEAMHRIVAMSRDVAEAAGRFSELARVAVERFNAGALVPAARMFEVAERLAREQKVEAATVDRIRHSLHQSLDEKRLSEFAENVDNHAHLRQVLAFFPQLSPKGLLAALEREPVHEQRRRQIMLLETHGEDARAEVIATFQARGERAHHFFQRNLLHLLRRIPPASDVSLGVELGFLEEMSSTNRHPMVVREAVGALGQVKPERSQPILAKRLHEFERVLVNGDGAWDGSEGWSILDRIVAPLARTESRAALRAVVEHGLSHEAKLGNRIARLAELGSRDLSAHRDFVGRIRDALKRALPTKVLGIALRKETDEAIHLVQALSGTKAPDVLQDLKDIAKRYPGTRCAAVAKRAITREAQPLASTPDFANGELPMYGLPRLLERLSQQHASGLLRLFDSSGEARGMLSLDEGKLNGCRAGLLRGEVAFYQLFQKPAQGSFSFEPHGKQSTTGAVAKRSVDLYPMILEALSRSGEYTRYRAVVLDERVLRPTGASPKPPPGETDGQLLNDLWTAVEQGATPAQFEATATVDSLRVRRILAHWLESGALTPAS